MPFFRRSSRKSTPKGGTAGGAAAAATAAGVGGGGAGTGAFAGYTSGSDKGRSPRTLSPRAVAAPRFGTGTTTAGARRRSSGRGAAVRRRSLRPLSLTEALTELFDVMRLPPGVDAASVRESGPRKEVIFALEQVFDSLDSYGVGSLVRSELDELVHNYLLLCRHRCQLQNRVYAESGGGSSRDMRADSQSVSEVSRQWLIADMTLSEDPSPIIDEMLSLWTHSGSASSGGAGGSPRAAARLGLITGQVFDALGGRNGRILKADFVERMPDVLFGERNILFGLRGEKDVEEEQSDEDEEEEHDERGDSFKPPPPSEPIPKDILMRHSTRKLVGSPPPPSSHPHRSSAVGAGSPIQRRSKLRHPTHPTQNDSNVSRSLGSEISTSTTDYSSRGFGFGAGPKPRPMGPRDSEAPVEIPFMDFAAPADEVFPGFGLAVASRQINSGYKAPLTALSAQQRSLAQTVAAAIAPSIMEHMRTGTLSHVSQMTAAFHHDFTLDEEEEYEFDYDDDYGDETDKEGTFLSHGSVLIGSVIERDVSDDIRGGEQSVSGLMKPRPMMRLTSSLSVEQRNRMNEHDDSPGTIRVKSPDTVMEVENEESESMKSESSSDSDSDSDIEMPTLNSPVKDTPDGGLDFDARLAQAMQLSVDETPGKLVSEGGGGDAVAASGVAQASSSGLSRIEAALMLSDDEYGGKSFDEAEEDQYNEEEDEDEDDGLPIPRPAPFKPKPQSAKIEGSEAVKKEDQIKDKQKSDEDSEEVGHETSDSELSILKEIGRTADLNTDSGSDDSSSASSVSSDSTDVSSDSESLSSYRGSDDEKRRKNKKKRKKQRKRRRKRRARRRQQTKRRKKRDKRRKRRREKKKEKDKKFEEALLAEMQATEAHKSIVTDFLENNPLLEGMKSDGAGSEDDDSSSLISISTSNIETDSDYDEILPGGARRSIAMSAIAAARSQKENPDGPIVGGSRRSMHNYQDSFAVAFRIWEKMQGIVFDPTMTAAIAMEAKGQVEYYAKAKGVTDLKITEEDVRWMAGDGGGTGVTPGGPTATSAAGAGISMDEELSLSKEMLMPDDGEDVSESDSEDSFGSSILDDSGDERLLSDDDFGARKKKKNKESSKTKKKRRKIDGDESSDDDSDVMVPDLGRATEDDRKKKEQRKSQLSRDFPSRRMSAAQAGGDTLVISKEMWNLAAQQEEAETAAAAAAAASAKAPSIGSTMQKGKPRSRTMSPTSSPKGSRSPRKKGDATVRAVREMFAESQRILDIEQERKSTRRTDDGKDAAIHQRLNALLESDSDDDGRGGITSQSGAVTSASHRDLDSFAVSMPTMRTPILGNIGSLDTMTPGEGEEIRRIQAALSGGSGAARSDLVLTKSTSSSTSSKMKRGRQDSESSVGLAFHSGRSEDAEGYSAETLVVKKPVSQMSLKSRKSDEDDDYGGRSTVITRARSQTTDSSRSSVTSKPLKAKKTSSPRGRRKGLGQSDMDSMMEEIGETPSKRRGLLEVSGSGPGSRKRASTGMLKRNKDKGSPSKRGLLGLEESETAHAKFGGFDIKDLSNPSRQVQKLMTTPMSAIAKRHSMPPSLGPAGGEEWKERTTDDGSSDSEERRKRKKKRKKRKSKKKKKDENDSSDDSSDDDTSKKKRKSSKKKSKKKHRRKSKSGKKKKKKSKSIQKSSSVDPPMVIGRAQTMQPMSSSARTLKSTTESPSMVKSQSSLIQQHRELPSHGFIEEYEHRALESAVDLDGGLVARSVIKEVSDVLKSEPDGIVRPNLDKSRFFAAPPKRKSMAKKRASTAGGTAGSSSSSSSSSSAMKKGRALREIERVKKQYADEQAMHTPMYPATPTEKRFEKCGRLIVKVVGAMNLGSAQKCLVSSAAGTDLSGTGSSSSSGGGGGSFNAYCVISVKSVDAKTRAIKGGSSPSFKEILIFNNFKPKKEKKRKKGGKVREARVTVMDKHTIRKDTTIGAGSFKLPSQFGELERFVVQLSNSKGQPRGIVVIDTYVQKYIFPESEFD